ncbi:MAG TPA: flagellar hook-length control protein FliK [Pyrinomonadaceae bacterium]|nr:flagellar hook-length control protein FliK [Pyrinomonadaceae bacterium]
MKVEQSKNSHAAADSKASFQNKNVNQSGVSPNKNDFLDSAMPPAPLSKSFAQILAETRNQNSGGSDDENSPTGRKREATESDEAQNEKETSRDVQARDAVEERERKQSDEGGGDGSDGNPGFGAFVFPAENKIFSANSIPAARSILHVADLERIVSSIRAQNLKNAQAIVIALKHSVLEGLQIRLTVEENGKLKAEFLAANEQIKNQLEARRHELTGIIRERGINLSEMSVRQGSDFSPGSGDETGGGRLSEKNISTAESNELSAENSGGDSTEDESNNRISYRV